jgi:hypothetical protein
MAPKPACTRAEVECVRRTLVEHFGVEFGGVAVQIDKSAGDGGGEHGGAVRGGAGEQFIDVGVFGTTQADQADARVSEQFGRVTTAAVRRGENDRRGSS